MKVLYLTVFLLIVSCITSAQKLFEGKECIIKTEFIYRSGDVPFPSCHASTIAEIKNGLIAAWFGGTEERAPDVGIWVSRHINGSWTIPVEAANGIQPGSKRLPCWNPVLHTDGDTILLFYKVGPSPSTWWGEMIKSTDSGVTWSQPVKLPEGIYGPIKNKPVLMADGTLLCPSSSEDNGWRVHIEFTGDNGRTWKRTGDINAKDLPMIQPTILKLKGGRIEMLVRTKVSKILASVSDDIGNTWSPFTGTGLPNPNSGIDAVTLKDGRHLLVYNHIVKDRNILNAAVSDNGSVWKAAVLLENESDNSEFSYPAVIQTADGKVHITYTWNRKLIKHVVLDPTSIKTAEITDYIWPVTK
jgi:predicted neuraminidase